MSGITPDRYPGTALVTGASSGIGEAYARYLARAGFPLVIVARNRDALDALAVELTSAHGVRVSVAVADLGEPDGPSSVKRATDALGSDVSVLVNNAGFGVTGALVGAEREKLLAMVDLNCRAVLDLCLLYAPAMAERRNGAVLVTASVGGHIPVPSMAAYGATKAFDRLLAEALWAELRPLGVDVLAVSPGPTTTAFAERAQFQVQELDSALYMAPETVVEAAARALGRGPAVVTGWSNWALTQLVRVLSRRQLALLSAWIFRGQSGSPA